MDITRQAVHDVRAWMVAGDGEAIASGSVGAACHVAALLIGRIDTALAAAGPDWLDPIVDAAAVGGGGDAAEIVAVARDLRNGGQRTELDLAQGHARTVGAIVGALLPVLVAGAAHIGGVTPAQIVADLFDQDAEAHSSALSSCRSPR